MANKERLSMDMQAQIRALHERKYSLRRIARCLKKSRKTVRKYLDKFEAEARVHKGRVDGPQAADAVVSSAGEPRGWMAKVDWDEATRELAKGVSYKTLYKELAANDVSYWTFWKTLKRRAALPVPTTALLVHKPGECVQVDYAQGINIVLIPWA